MTDFAAPLRHGPITRVCDGVHHVRGSFRMGPGVTVGRTMAIVEGDDGLIVANAVRLSDAGMAELDALGTVAHLVKLSDAHYVDEPYYVDRYRPAFWTLPGADLRGLESTHTLGPDGPVAGGVVVDLPQASRAREAVYLVPHGGGTLITCDALQNHVDSVNLSVVARIITPWLGFRGGVIIPRMWRRLQKVTPDLIDPAFGPIAALRFENLVPGHGPPAAGGADEAVRAAIAQVRG